MKKILPLACTVLLLMGSVVLGPSQFVEAEQPLVYSPGILWAGGDAEECPDTICSLQYVEFGRSTRVPLGQGGNYFKFDFDETGAAYLPSSAFRVVRKVLGGISTTVADKDKNGIKAPIAIATSMEEIFFLVKDDGAYRIARTSDEFQQAVKIETSSSLSIEADDWQPTHILTDSRGNLFLFNRSDAHGEIVKVEGDKMSIFYKFDSSNWIANFRDWTIDANDNIYITTTGGEAEPDKGNGNKILKLDPTGELTDLVAGGFGFNGEAVDAIDAKLRDPHQITYFPKKNALIWAEGNPGTEGTKKLRYIKDGKVYTLKEYEEFTIVAGLHGYLDHLYVVRNHPESDLKGYQIFQHNMIDYQAPEEPEPAPTPAPEPEPEPVEEDANCRDEKQNGDETGIDCGGVCGGFWYDDACHDEPKPEPEPAPTPAPEPEAHPVKITIDYSDGKQIFLDVSKNHDFYNSTRWAKEMGLVNGYVDGNVGVDNRLSRGEMIEILFRMYNKGLLNQ